MNLADILPLLQCPACRADLIHREEGMVCTSCARPFPLSVEGIPLLFHPNDWEPDKGDVTLKMQAFYEETPFPNYDGFDTLPVLREKARHSHFMKLMDDQIPLSWRILECGCGTGQWTNFLAAGGRQAFGTDICLNSLRLGHGFRDRTGLESARFLQMNLFRPCFKPESFDLVICNGVLHHTSDPRLGLHTLARLVRPGGYLLIGLYHTYGRLWTDLRRWLFRVTGNRLLFLDKRVVNEHSSAAKRKAWFMDQYANPHESKHTIREALDWTRQADLIPLRTIPRQVPFAQLGLDEQLFEADTQQGSFLEQRLAEWLLALGANAAEGGFFIVIARKPPSAPSSTVSPPQRGEPT